MHPTRLSNILAANGDPCESPSNCWPRNLRFLARRTALPCRARNRAPDQNAGVRKPSEGDRGVEQLRILQTTFCNHYCHSPVYQTSLPLATANRRFFYWPLACSNIPTLPSSGGAWQAGSAIFFRKVVKLLIPRDIKLTTRSQIPRATPVVLE